MRFWDASALVPLLTEQLQSAAMVAVSRQDRAMGVWWGTEVECASALARMERSGAAWEGNDGPWSRLARMARDWKVVQAAPEVSAAAVRLLRVHPLRAGGALQLAAALLLAEHQPNTLPFAALDARLRLAAEKEGFPLLPATLD